MVQNDVFPSKFKASFKPSDLIDVYSGVSDQHRLGKLQLIIMKSKANFEMTLS